jgi:hypothetical protein
MKPEVISCKCNVRKRKTDVAKRRAVQPVMLRPSKHIGWVATIEFLGLWEQLNNWGIKEVEPEPLCTKWAIAPLHIRKRNVEPDQTLKIAID